MKNYPGLIRRNGGVYYVRVRVPQDLIGVLKRRELKQTLGTKDVRTARREYQRVYGQLLRTITEAREKLGGSASSPVAVHTPELEAAVRDWFFRTWDSCEAAFNGPLAADSPTPEEMVQQAEFELDVLTQPTDEQRGNLLFMAKQILARRGHPSPAPESIEILASYIRRGMGLINTAVIDHFKGRKFHHAIDDPLFVRREAALPLDGKRTVAQLIEAFSSDPQRQKLSPKNRAGFVMAFRLLKEIAGAETLIDQVSRQHAREIQSLLAKLPPNATKRFKGMTLRHAADKAEADGLGRLEAKTAENILRNLSAFFSWAEKEHHISKNPLEGLRPLQDPKRPEDQRQPFDAASLRKIFESTLYSEPSQRSRYPGRYWIPLIALYHGARSNEICQLEVSDVVVEEGIPAFNITTTSANGQVKRLKSANAVRVIPIHPILLQLGFMEFLEAQRQRGSVVLFPDVPVAATGYRSDNFQKWFARFRKQIGLRDPRMTFHSFRHNFNDAARVANVPGEIVEALAGWASERGMRRHYGEGYTLRRKLVEISKISYPVDTLLLGAPALA